MLVLKAENTAVVLIDLQKGVVALPGAPYPSSVVVANAVRLLKAARAAAATVVLVHTGPTTDTRDRLAPLADAPLPRRNLPVDWMEFVPEITAAPSDLVILKRQWGAFYGTELDLQLRRRRISTLVLGGIATEFGVESTAREAYERGYNQIFVSDAMTGLTAEGHDHTLRQILPRIGCVRDTVDVVAALAI